MSDPKTYKITEIFLTCQGEGYHTGVKSLFIRFHGCNLQCQFCDTDFSYFDYEFTKEQFMEEIEKRQEGAKTRFQHIVITGGEPLMQMDFDLACLLANAGYTVQIESNGTVEAPWLDELHWQDLESFYLTCSPKAKEIKEQLLPHISELKVVHFNKKFTEHIIDTYCGIFGEKATHSLVYIQPLEKDGNMNIGNVHEFILSREEPLRMSIQVQKIGEFE